MENYFLHCNQSEINLRLAHNEVLHVRQKVTKNELTKCSQQKRCWIRSEKTMIPGSGVFVYKLNSCWWW